MVCDVCKDGDAVIQLTEIEGSGVRQLHLCEKCAAERGVETNINSLRDLLRRVHGNSRHIGRRYVAPLPTELPHVSSATELRDRLKRAIEAEQFELAADIRDKLRGME